jgi:hypothetical protein
VAQAKLGFRNRFSGLLQAWRFDAITGSTRSPYQQRTIMFLNTFRLTSPTFALIVKEDRRIALTVPTGAVILASNVEGDKMVDVLWEGRTLLMFPDDIRASGERVTTSSP